MQSLRRPRTALLLVLIALACNGGGTFDCHEGHDDGDKVDVHGKVNN